MKKIKTFAKIGLVLNMFCVGFFFTYAVIWFLIDLPIMWWATWVLIALALLSTFGLVKWVAHD